MPRPRSELTYIGFRPIGGWTSEDPVNASPAQMVDGENVWIVDGDLVPRSRLTITTAMTGRPLSLDGLPFLFVSSPIDQNYQELYAAQGSNTTFRVWKMNNDNTAEGGGTWTVIAQQDSKASLDPRYFVDAADVWDLSGQGSAVVLCDGVNAELAVIRGSNLSYFQDFSNTGYTQPRSVAAFDNSPVVWGARTEVISTVSEGWSTTQNGSEGTVTISGSTLTAYSNLEVTKRADSRYTVVFDYSTGDLGEVPAGAVVVSLHYNDGASSTNWLATGQTATYGANESGRQTFSFATTLQANYDLRLMMAADSGSPATVVDLSTLTLHDSAQTTPGVLYEQSATSPRNVVIWPVGTNYSNWTGVGAASEELVDAKGAATRIFTVGDEMVLGTTQQVWRGRFVGGPFRFQFSPIDRNLGIPLREAAINTPFGLFWLDTDHTVWHYGGGRPEPIGLPIRETLKAQLTLDAADPNVRRNAHFFSYDPARRAVTLHYNSNVQALFAIGADKGFTYFPDFNRWVRQDFEATSSGVTVRLQCTACGSQDMAEEPIGGANIYSDVAPKTTYFGTSLGSVVQYSPTAEKDYSFESVTARWISGALFAGDMLNQKHIERVYVDTHSQPASTLSVAVTVNGGSTFGTERTTSPAVASNSSRNRITMGDASGYYPQLRIRSDDTGWAISRIAVVASVSDDG